MTALLEGLGQSLIRAPAQPWSAVAELKYSQKTAQILQLIEHNARVFWHFDRPLPESEVSMDDTDRRLIALLRSDGRASVASLAKALGVSRGTVQNRMARLAADGTIVGYTVRLKPDIEEQRMRAFMTVAVEGNQVDAVIKALRGEPAVTALYSTNGRWDVVAELRAESLEGFDRVLARIRLIEGISQTETSLLLSTFKF
jgi:DNA-binding Lrp family transcriptional regulator